jgi:hypothetical protein
MRRSALMITWTLRCDDADGAPVPKVGISADHNIALRRGRPQATHSAASAPPAGTMTGGLHRKPAATPFG